MTDDEKSEAANIVARAVDDLREAHRVAHKDWHALFVTLGRAAAAAEAGDRERLGALLTDAGEIELRLTRREDCIQRAERRLAAKIRTRQIRCRILVTADVWFCRAAGCGSRGRIEKDGLVEKRHGHLPVEHASPVPHELFRNPPDFTGEERPPCLFDYVARVGIASPKDREP